MVTLFVKYLISQVTERNLRNDIYAVGFPGGSEDKVSPHNAGDPGLILG